MSDVVVTRRIAASPATVFSFFTDAERWTSWQAANGSGRRRDPLSSDEHRAAPPES